ncbi:ATP-binding protein [Sphingomonas xinjiangensis]|uniref:histidine kinase n=1 Tax=Sphingomonas xinjiangensis TaxID=643568 RepID=A0A840YMD8_9SPHN|nr:ATP-binding protein [Sphingomonas xinjiangensis]MBB5710966.1 two-component system sensor histidine kinase RegB [Sphingomonas xinjiangensis]
MRPMFAGDEAARRNLLLLSHLRWLAVGGQLATILAVHMLLGVRLPMTPMLLTLFVLVMVNLLALTLYLKGPVNNTTLLATLIMDVGCLSVQLYFSGGATNPFLALYLLQVVLGAVLLEAWSSWLLVALTSGALGILALWAPSLDLPSALRIALPRPYILALWFNYTLAAVLLELFVTRVTRNLRHRDAYLATLRQRAAEEEHVVRIGLLASGAAHELGTPLASLSVALGDWRAEPAVSADPRLAEEVSEMQAEVARCKEIVAGILFAAGEVTGQAPERTTLRRFLNGIVANAAARDSIRIEDRLGRDIAIVSDKALGQALLNLLDNAAEADASNILLSAALSEDMLILSVQDDGRGFPANILSALGQPYQSTKTRRGAGLGLFLTNNVLRTLGGTLEARNRPGRGAQVALRLPLDALAIEAP